MLKHKLQQKLWMGAASGILGTISSLIHNKKSKETHFNRGMLLGGVTGAVVGAAAALLFAPKAGNELIQDIIHPLTRLRKPRPFFHVTTKRKTKAHPHPHSKIAKKKAVHTAPRKTNHHKSTKVASKKGSSSHKHKSE